MQLRIGNPNLYYGFIIPEERHLSTFVESLNRKLKKVSLWETSEFPILRWNLKNLSRGLNPPKPGLNLAPA